MSVRTSSEDLTLGTTVDPTELETELAGLLSEPSREESLRPSRWAGTLPGVMAGKRPPRNPFAPVLCH